MPVITRSNRILEVDLDTLGENNLFPPSNADPPGCAALLLRLRN